MIQNGGQEPLNMKTAAPEPTFGLIHVFFAIREELAELAPRLRSTAIAFQEALNESLLIPIQQCRARASHPRSASAGAPSCAVALTPIGTDQDSQPMSDEGGGGGPGPEPLPLLSGTDRMEVSGDEICAAQPVPVLLTDSQMEVWNLLEGYAKTAKQMAVELKLGVTGECAIIKRIDAIRKAGLTVLNKRGLGYYRPDAPPAGLVELNELAGTPVGLRSRG